ncbi:hypothetical protein [Actinoplanes regularis]|uniref:hypothetical protein n=1 Tax=Actinoplanes regularis TaxID=52697 RepID=UPI0024A3D533|nr:hypothetical protein [Actinoplanes regularis]GLW35003.1 hypothetical protein Areg01_79390 [Actinoplanes regularis]
MTHDNHPERPADRLARALGLPPLPPWTEADEVALDEKLAKADRELAELNARRRAQAA